MDDSGGMRGKDLVQSAYRGRTRGGKEAPENRLKLLCLLVIMDLSLYLGSHNSGTEKIYQGRTNFLH